MQQARVICSWDVGIKHLAFCLVKQDLTILDWGVINLIKEDAITCTYINIKTKTTCTRPAIYTGLTQDSITQYYCNGHKKHHTDLELDWTEKNIINLPTPGLCTHLINNKECNKKALKTINSKPLCKLHENQFIINLKKSYELKSIKKINSYSHDIQKLATSMYTKLDAIPNLLTATEVLIENQPTLMNPTMKTISRTLSFSYFVLRGVVDNKKPMLVKHFSPSNKIKLNNQETEKLINSLTNTDKVYKASLALVTKHWGLNQEIVKQHESSLVKLAITKLVNKNYDHKQDVFYITLKQELDNLDDLVKKIEKDRTNNYELTKNISIKYTEILIKNQANWIKVFNKFERKMTLVMLFYKPKNI